MTAKTRNNLKSEFETGDVPDGTDYSDLIDSFLSLSDTDAQTITSTVNLPTANITTKMSAAAANVTGELSVSGATTLDGPVQVAGSASFQNVALAGTIVYAKVITAASVTGQSSAAAPNTYRKYLQIYVSGVEYAIPLAVGK